MTTSAEPTPQSSDGIYQQLRRKILDGTLAPGTKVNILQVARDMGVSATPVREALSQLQGDGLLVAFSNRGFATTEILDARGVRSLFEFRLLVEPWSARAAATDSLGNPAVDLAHEISTFNAESDSVRHAMIDHDERFHRRILEATENHVVIDAYQRSHCHLHLFRMIGNNWDWKASLSQHRDIQDAISRADGDGAEEAMRHHLHAAYGGFLETLSAQDSQSATLRSSHTPSMIRSR